MKHLPAYTVMLKCFKFQMFAFILHVSQATKRLHSVSDIYVRVCVVKKNSKNFYHSFFIQINPIPSDKLQLAKELSPGETADLILATEFIDLIPSTPCVFKRAVSVKLPLPTGVEVEEENDDIAVLQKTENGWELVDSKYKFTRTTVTFDTKSLSK